LEGRVEMDVAPGLKNFLWKLGSNILATWENLFRKGILTDPFCPFCLANTEPTFHALWSCPASIAVWQECGRRLQKLVIEECDGLHLIKALKDILDKKGFLEALIVLPLLWLRRNEYVFKGRFHPPSQLIMKVRNMVAECEEIL
jgi:hypothetical protein